MAPYKEHYGYEATGYHHRHTIEMHQTHHNA